MIFDIQRYSIHDGEGIRTNIFFKGCPLRCLWCSNPESQSFFPEILFDEKKCMGFGDCTGAGDGAFYFKGNALKINWNALINTQIYREICPSTALSVIGNEKSVSQIIGEIEKDLQFYRQSGGGITLTGGEPFAQGEDLLWLVRELFTRNIPIAAETCLHLPWEKIHPYIPYISEFLVDLKHVEAKKFRTYTGGHIRKVLKNLDLLDKCGVLYRLRIPVIPGFNHSLEDMAQIIDHAETLHHCRHVDFIPYHTLGENKYKMLGKSYPYEGFRSVQNRELTPYLQYAEKKGFQVSIGG